MAESQSDNSMLTDLDSIRKREGKRIILGVSIATGAILIGSIVINVGSGSEARILLQSMLPSVRFLCSAVMTATATILTLMMTMLSLSGSQDAQFKQDYFERVRRMARIDAYVFSGAMILLLLLSVPISESQDVPSNWFTAIYYFVLVGSAVLGGALCAIIFMLYNAILGLTHVLHPEKESNMIEG